MTILHQDRIYQADTLKELLDDCSKRIRRFVLSKDVVQHETQTSVSSVMPEWHRHYADGVQFDNGTIVLYHPGAMQTSSVQVFASYKDMMISSPAHEYEVHWLD